MTEPAPDRDRDRPDAAAHPEPANIRFLRLLVTALTGVMILGIVSVVVLMALRLNQPPPPRLPAEITLPDGVTAHAVTFGPGWYAVITRNGEILVFDADDGSLRQRTAIVE
jgi:hypothetical protein